jgi:hypothetical protein
MMMTQNYTQSQLADRSRAHATDEDDQVKEAWLMKLGYPRHGHRSTREAYSHDLISSNRSVATVSHSTSASPQATNKNKRTLLEGSETAISPIEKKARLNNEPLILSLDSTTAPNTTRVLRPSKSHGSSYVFGSFE